MKDTDFAWLAGFMEGEGSFFIAHQKRKGRDGDQLRGTISVDNTDPSLIQRSVEIFESLGCVMHISQGMKEKSTKMVYRIGTANAGYIKAICEALIPHLVGEKLAKAKLLLSFVTKRLEKRAANNKQYDQEDWSIFEESRSSQTTREAA
jgi:hypothetical protein